MYAVYALTSPFDPKGTHPAFPSSFSLTNNSEPIMAKVPFQPTIPSIHTSDPAHIPPLLLFHHPSPTLNQLDPTLILKTVLLCDSISSLQPAGPQLDTKDRSIRRFHNPHSMARHP